jgi:hypothetical protein
MFNDMGRKHMQQSPGLTNAPNIIACGVFKPLLEYLQFERRFPHVRLTFLPANLHVYPAKLKDHILSALRAAQRRGDRAICLYGDCFPGMDDFCREHCIARVPGTHCYEMLLGSKRFRRIIDEIAGTYFLERYLIEEFEKCCAKPLELHDDEVREYLFRHYKRLVYVRQASDPDLVPKAGKLAEFLGLALEVRDADYTHLEKELTTLIRRKLR